MSDTYGDGHRLDRFILALEIGAAAACFLVGGLAGFAIGLWAS